MKSYKIIYANHFGNSCLLLESLNQKIVYLEFNQLILSVETQELNSFIKSTQEIINLHSNCKCPRDFKNKMIVYKGNQMEIKMVLSYNQLLQLIDLLKGTVFKISMDDILKSYRIKN
ncbi:hypothetical protein [Ochrovirga pacifica]|uniref:hypothetical protein n=1 Tax=Ochrovirga pacifica TaxID=1042376 RepID=UPI0002557BB8|nr:hypothetical protein [Ochrovirga pacifica]